jgi:hypothetical protein
MWNVRCLWVDDRRRLGWLWLRVWDWSWALSKRKSGARVLNQSLTSHSGWEWQWEGRMSAPYLLFNQGGLVLVLLFSLPILKYCWRAEETEAEGLTIFGHVMASACFTVFVNIEDLISDFSASLFPLHSHYLYFYVPLSHPIVTSHNCPSPLQDRQITWLSTERWPTSLMNYFFSSQSPSSFLVSTQNNPASCQHKTSPPNLAIMLSKGFSPSFLWRMSFMGFRVLSFPFKSELRRFLSKRLWTCV